MKTSALTTVFLIAVATLNAADFQAVTCEGAYPHHLQGVCTDDRDSIFWV
jgi:hypothetical protein